MFQAGESFSFQHSVKKLKGKWKTMISPEGLRGCTRDTPSS